MKNIHLFLCIVLNLIALSTFASQVQPLRPATTEEITSSFGFPAPHTFVNETQPLRQPTSDEINDFYKYLYSFHMFCISEAKKSLTEQELKQLLKQKTMASPALKAKAHLTDDELANWALIRRAINELKPFKK